MTFVLIHDKLLVTPEEVSDKDANGLFTPDSLKSKPNKGTVVETGKGRPGESMTVIKGDTVTFPKSVGYPVTVDGKEYLIIEEADILIAERTGE